MPGQFRGPEHRDRHSPTATTFAHAFKLTTTATSPIDGGVRRRTPSRDLPQFGADVRRRGRSNDTITVHPNFGGSVDVQGDSGRRHDPTPSAALGRGATGMPAPTRSRWRRSSSPPPGFSAAYGGAGDDTISAQAGLRT